MLWIAASCVNDTMIQQRRPTKGVQYPMKGVSMRLSRLAMSLSGVIVLGLAVFVAVGAGRPTAHHGGPTLTIATVNNPDMVVMQSLTSDFTKKTGISVKYV